MEEVFKKIAKAYDQISCHKKREEYKLKRNEERWKREEEEYYTRHPEKRENGRNQEGSYPFSGAFLSQNYKYVSRAPSEKRPEPTTFNPFKERIEAKKKYRKLRKIAIVVLGLTGVILLAILFQRLLVTTLTYVNL
jgi:hypothetical protein